jgi:hypothetical protein
MMTQKSPKSPDMMYCEKCDYKCCKKSDWTKHLSTLKHLNVDKCLQENRQNRQTEVYCECGKKYKTRQSLSIHRKKCSYFTNESQTTSSKNDLNIITPDLIVSILNQNNEIFKENQDLRELLVEQNRSLMELIKTHNTNTITNSNNTTHMNSHNKFNMNVFLNETCKDAMNIMDFVNSIKLQLSDLENVGRVGFIDGISSIIVKNLKALDVSQRPLHCSDMKRETMYVKDEDKWVKEDPDNKKLKSAIKCVASKNFQLLPEWKKKYPDCIYSDSKNSDQYNKLLIESVGGKFDTDVNDTKIIKRIAKEVAIEKV